MATLDWLIILAYFGSLAALTWWVMRRGKDTADDYFLASRDLGWLIVGASIFASNIGSEHLVGLAGSGATSGVALAHYELHAWCLLVRGWMLVPFYIRSRVYTLPELRLELGGTVFNSFWIGSVLVVVLTGLYTVIGGLRAVAYTEAVQTAVL